MSIDPQLSKSQVFPLFQYRDRIWLSLASGAGGKGGLSFHRTRKNPRGGPDGGDGGDGGSLILSATPKVSNFDHLKKKTRYQANSGQDGGPQLKKGRGGKDLTLDLPVGALIRNEKEKILKDFIKEEKYIFLKGGRGGRGNAFFKSSLDQAPRQFQKGEKSRKERVILEYKAPVHTALIGKVNTGKSSFFNLVTNAKSKTAPYPYTTLSPHVGQLKDFSVSSFIMDIPGLEKGAVKNISKGLSFLRSIQRAKILLHFISCSSEDPLKDKKEIEEELKNFDKKQKENYFESFANKKMLYVFSKTDELKDESLDDFIKNLGLKKDQKFFPLSNKTKKGLKSVLSEMEKEIRGFSN